MEITRIYLDQKEVLGTKAFVSGMEDVPATQYSPAYRIFQLDSVKERSAFVICDNPRNADSVKTTAQIEKTDGFSIVHRTFTHAGKRYSEPVFLVDGLKVKK
ncbi:hypothetical protein [Streptococcus sp. zg-JUN1979]|uniref:hypothetical protein n=1 Tax=Streptococcus sp. zg-JUN1979 TaxID=3391450 RepID=UPI0039A63C74